MGTMATLDKTGDSKHIWDKDSPEEVATARAAFDALRKKGYAAYSVDRKGNKGTLIREFDPNAESLILAPQLVGG